jgi:hypothetical protein
VSVIFTAPVTHQDQGEGRNSKKFRYEAILLFHSMPLFALADPEIIGAMLCPIVCSNLMVYNQPFGGSQHRR